MNDKSSNLNQILIYNLSSNYDLTSSDFNLIHTIQ